MYIDPHLAVVLAAVFGLAVGSWLTTVVHRLPHILEYDWDETSRETSRDMSYDAAHDIASDTFHAAAGHGAARTRPSLFRPACQCPACAAPIRGWRRIPVLGWLGLRGRCGDCGARIPWRYPAIELMTAALYALCVWHYGASLAALCALVLAAALIALAWIDARTGLLPDVITLPLVWAGLLVNTQSVFTTPVQAILGAALGYLFLRCLHHVFLWTTGREGMGYGDFKLLAALGAWLGVAALPMVLIVSSLTGVVVGLGLILARRVGRHQPQPFGPYLALAGIVGLLMAGPPWV
ncbi:prepilin peptidase [Bordetella genomosp. 9]|uniref:Prepilin leader peptidase/N-methyltransferase n=1 Tax=Bordetella genomosp. 9 TaxID=1416803 RepID=A0A261R7K6_9BORD|nr:A24 family peptidase [Bordetella genomosp. 9]OZI20610.1 prepilin peptidase [Bordetella genomosp. 9]